MRADPFMDEAGPTQHLAAHHAVPSLLDLSLSEGSACSDERDLEVPCPTHPCDTGLSALWEHVSTQSTVKRTRVAAAWLCPLVARR